MEQMNPTDIKTAEPFEGLFPIDAATLTAVADHMEKHGYDPAQPLVIWYERDVLLDGHTRLAAARQLKFTRVPVVKKGFRTENQAVEYAIHCQRDRRNLSDADLLRWIQEVDKRKKQGERTDLAQPCAKSSKSSEQTAAVVGTSARKVEQARTVIDQADEETKAKVASGELSINKAYNETRAAQRQVKTYFPDRPDKSKSNLSGTDSSGNPGTPLDEVGNEIPPKARAAFQRSDEVQQYLTTISKLKGLARQAENGDPLYAALNASQFQADCGNLYRALAAIKPYAVCPYCTGQGCEACHGRGWVGKLVYEHAPADMKGGTS